MDLLHKQVLVLSSKVDALYQIVDQLNQKVAQALLEGSFSASGSPSSMRHGITSHGTSLGVNYIHHTRGITPEHKDILADEDYSQNRHMNGDRHLSTEVQIQRLTAQLTAAYNQIAALEEQLLTHHNH
ncbi:hypothetical protein L3556_10015 [Candidatus Synechococcus calcipolaris G9]|uniref:Uncharacterized protein n=1 Tax=Candidatus Synechococcus calcipolaris G9 TaxID=1497997 RepID=A0ABT6F0B4_9SYNE|nr:hypothetical protein [Candidatus Synechococcus calcipolaris]MDG2991261.1 hypothetical protein [Candidatus Synechococcus calcipolaris G9]